MQKQIAVVVALLGAAIATGPCYAQRTRLQGKVPFAFQVGNKTMPAGDYLIQRAMATDPCVQLLRRSDSKATVLTSTIPVDARDGLSEPVLVFHKYGNRYFLSEIWTGGSLGRKLSESKQEKELASEAAVSQVAVSLEQVSERGL